jgi:hypothetical protein
VVTKLDRLGRSLEHLFELSKQPQTRSGRCRVFAANTRKRPDGAGQHRTYEERPAVLLSQVAGAFRVVWRVRDSNPRRRSRLIYSGSRKPAVTCALAPSISNFGAHLGLGALQAPVMPALSSGGNRRTRVVTRWSSRSSAAHLAPRRCSTTDD